MSGSVGGLTYSRNRYGFYVKQRPNPVNPATSKQTEARSRFGSATKMFNSVTTAQRQAWNDFGANLFISRKGKTGATGSVAFTSLYNASSAMLAIASATTLVTAAAGGAKGVVSLPVNPPAVLADNFAKGTNTVALSVGACSYTPAGAVSVEINCSEALTNVAASPLRNGNNTAAGFAVYASTIFRNENGYASAREGRMILAAPNIITLPVSVTKFTLSGNAQGQPMKAWIRLSVYMVDTFGQAAIVGQKTVQIN